MVVKNFSQQKIKSIFHLIRNPKAHTPKILWTIKEEAALDMLTLISVAHKYLDRIVKKLNAEMAAYAELKKSVTSCVCFHHLRL